jgi:glycosyltransferase involved in cell wall biosynthesis
LIDKEKYDVDLMVLVRGGAFEQFVPPTVHFTDYQKPQGFGRLRWLVCQNLFSLKLRTFAAKKQHGAELRWKTMGCAYPKVAKHYDVAIAYQQGLPTYFVVEKVSAEKKHAWVNVDMMKAGYSVDYNKEFYSQLTNVVAVSDTVANQLADSGFTTRDKIVTVFDILNVDLIRRMAEETPDTRFRTDKLTIVTVGRVAPPKNYPLAVETAALLKKRGLDFRWYFVGDGPERSKVETLVRSKDVEDCVVLLGMQVNPYPYMKGADIYVQTSSFEGFGLTLTEARLLHKPEVSTNFPVVYDQITDGVNGLIATMTADDLADKIIKLATNTILREQLVEATKREVNMTAQTESKKVNQLLSR